MKSRGPTPASASSENAYWPRNARLRQDEVVRTTSSVARLIRLIRLIRRFFARHVSRVRRGGSLNRGEPKEGPPRTSASRLSLTRARRGPGRGGHRGGPRDQRPRVEPVRVSGRSRRGDAKGSDRAPVGESGRRRAMAGRRSRERRAGWSVGGRTSRIVASSRGALVPPRRARRDAPSLKGRARIWHVGQKNDE